MKQLYPWQSASWQSLQALRKRMPHALLLKGAQGIGKLDLALNFAGSLLCEHPTEDGISCGKCDSCRWFEQDSHPDFRLVQPEVLNSGEGGEVKAGGKTSAASFAKKPSREISVDQIRDLANFSNLSSHRGGYRIILIHPAEAMNSNAANSLLKTLEEPTDHLLFLLVTHKPQQLLPTILSRCLSFCLSTPAAEAGEVWLAEQGVSDPVQALAQTGFAPLQALLWAESGEGAEERRILLEVIPQPSRMDPLQVAENLQRAVPIHVIHCLQQWCQDLASAKLAGKVRYFPEYSPVLIKLAANISTPDLMKLHKQLLVARQAAYHPLNQKLCMESLLLSYRQSFTAS